MKKVLKEIKDVGMLFIAIVVLLSTIPFIIIGFCYEIIIDGINIGRESFVELSEYFKNN
jgi:hypothetical protein